MSGEQFILPGAPVFRIRAVEPSTLLRISGLLSCWSGVSLLHRASPLRWGSRRRLADEMKRTGRVTFLAHVWRR